MNLPLLVVDVQNGFLNDFTRHIPGRIAHLIERDRPDPVLFTRFLNQPESPYRRHLGWDGCDSSPDADVADELKPFAVEERVFTKAGLAGISDDLKAHLRSAGFSSIALVGIDTDMCVLKIALDLFDLGIEPLIFTDCCASTAGLQAHFAGLAVLARNIGADRLRDAGLNDGHLAAPTPEHDQQRA